MTGILAIDNEYGMLCEDAPLGPRRRLDDGAIASLESFGERYKQLSNLGSNAAELLGLGRDLYHWLEGGDGQLGKLLRVAARPLRFEILVASHYPSPAEWILLHAPWELLADDQGHLAGNVLLSFSPVRRITPSTAPPPPLDQLRLGLVFMAASPRGDEEIDYEAEEAAIMTAVGASKIDFLVEESGNLAELGDRIAEQPTMQVLHLSCRGDSAWRRGPDAAPKPVLLLEDRTGDPLITDAAAFVEGLRGHRPPLIFLSACGTASRSGATGLPDYRRPKRSQGGVPADSLAAALVERGLPAVLGWDGPIAERGAIAFAAELYERLSAKSDLADAVAAARRSLINQAEGAGRRDWHMARLWLGSHRGGPIVGGTRRRAMLPGSRGEKEFFAKHRGQAPLASHEMFVGRRRELQTALRVLRGHDYAGVLLHGMGGVGKSSLAARIASRRPDLRLAVVFEHYTA
jgi:hypothetical protein